MERTLSRENVALAKRSPFIRHLPTEVADVVLRGATARFYGRGATMFHQHEKAENLWILADGWVRLYRTTAEGHEADIGLLPRGEDFGGMTALVGGPYPVTAEAATDCIVITATTGELRERFLTNPAVILAMMQSAGHKVNLLMAVVEQLRIASGPQRVADFLLGLCADDAVGARLTLPYNKKLIAASLGMKRESLSRAFQRLRAQGVEVDNSEVRIASVPALRLWLKSQNADD